MPDLTPSDASPARQVETTLFRALVVLRLIVLGYALALNASRFPQFARPGLAVVVLGAMAAWTAFVSWAYDAPRRRRLPLYLADLAVTVVLLLSTPLVQSRQMLDRHASTMPTFWVMAAVLAWAAGRHWAEALGAALAVSAADLSVRAAITGATWGNIFLLLLAAGVVGYAASILRDAAEMRAAAERSAAAQAERSRLARAVHDGVLQVLGLVQRRVAEAGSALADLGQLAAEQEAALRALVQSDARAVSTAGAPATDRGADFRADLCAALGALQSDTVSVAGPGQPVLLPTQEVEQLRAVVEECLSNVRRHVGERARAWVLVEQLPEKVAVTVRDEGPGIPPGRLDRAAVEGRLGVRESICGRMADLGGRAELVTGPGSGTEWELTVPRSVT